MQLSYKAKKLLRNYREAAVELSQKGSYDPADHFAIEQNFTICAKNLTNYIKELEARNAQ